MAVSRPAAPETGLKAPTTAPTMSAAIPRLTSIGPEEPVIAAVSPRESKFPDTPPAESASRTSEVFAKNSPPGPRKRRNFPRHTDTSCLPDLYLLPPDLVRAIYLSLDSMRGTWSDKGRYRHHKTYQHNSNVSPVSPVGALPIRIIRVCRCHRTGERAAHGAELVDAVME